ncbi:helix-turn-helix transcriptional regulator [Billgrantia kenyensis]|uniref:LuxR family transcriptional regulator n=1 Tax=Billgrantia kenyensis TaxID=321266 RepID=A0A7V9W5A0_9GAMM|nr:LuxR family transcriptional regulator [Halomonas kenyensis]MBA2781275.1 LuxR family transcriptional regulator [Halomonas kenyensis]MCG6663938.1 LuxR family transcriptional regulator [Halomonas kenyensis]
MFNDIENQLKEITNKAEFFSTFEKILQSCGVSKYAYVYTPLSLDQVSDIYIFGNYDHAWVGIYKGEKYYRIDPVMLLSSRTPFPFFWKDIPMNIKGKSDIFEMAQDYGIGKGYSIPMHDPGFSFGSLHLSVDRNDTNFEMRISQNCLLLRLLSIMVHSYFSQDVKQYNSICLSSREKECLFWVSQGKTYWETAIILGVTERTIKFHMSNMAKKLNVANAKQLIAKALAMNLLAEV